MCQLPETEVAPGYQAQPPRGPGPATEKDKLLELPCKAFRQSKNRIHRLFKRPSMLLEGWVLGQEEEQTSYSHLRVWAGTQNQTDSKLWPRTSAG